MGISLVGCDPAGSSVAITSATDAIRILEGKAGQGYGAAKEVREFYSVLLAAKLNVARANALGGPLGTAFIYGTETTVTEALATADAALARHCHGVTCDGAKGCPLGGPVIPPQDGANLDGLSASQPFVESISANELTYHP